MHVEFFVDHAWTIPDAPNMAAKQSLNPRLDLFICNIKPSHSHTTWIKFASSDAGDYIWNVTHSFFYSFNIHSFIHSRVIQGL